MTAAGTTNRRRAAGLILATREQKVLVGTRAKNVPFLGGFVAFPGGMHQPEDDALAEALFLRRDLESLAKATALRELYEETGLYLDGNRLLRAPRDLQRTAFSDALASLGHPRPDFAAMFEAGRWLTPAYSFEAIDARFFTMIVEEPEGQWSEPPSRLEIGSRSAAGSRTGSSSATSSSSSGTGSGSATSSSSSGTGFGSATESALGPGSTSGSGPGSGSGSGSELENVRFARAADLLEAHERLQLALAPPTRAQIRVISTGIERLGERLSAIVGAQGEAIDYFEILPGIVMVPLKTPTLPPATHTNTYLVGGDRWIVVDPATYADEERDKLLEAIDEHTKGRVEAIVLTHHHVDHVGSAKWLSDRLGVPIRGHPITRSLLHPKIVVTDSIDEGDVIDLGRDQRGRLVALTTLFTPGHAPGHIVLVDRRENKNVMIVGDMVASVGTIIIDPPEGDMAVYIAQLERLAAFEDSIILPAHGAPLLSGRDKLLAYVAHRRRREAKILDALAHSGRSSAVDLLDEAYADTPKRLYPLAARSCLAHLEKLVTDGRAARDEDEFWLL